MALKAREIRLRSRPVGLPGADNFELIHVDLPDPGPGEVLVRNIWMSVDPYMRGRMYDRPSYVPPFVLGQALQGGAIGRVEKSNDPHLKPGDLVESMNGWRDAFVAHGAGVQKLPDHGIQAQAYLGVLGMTGMTAYTGFYRIGKPKPGETVFVSGAGGAVGATVCQIAKIRDCTVIASAGTDAKLDWLKRVGVDATVNYKTCGNLLKAVREAAPNGIDFDNVGGDHLEVAIEVARPWARFIECGMISIYNDSEPKPGPRNMAYIVGKRLKLQGFIVFDFLDMRPQFLSDMSAWVKNGRIKWEETVESGIENAPKAFLNLFAGANTGKMLVKLD